MSYFTETLDRAMDRINGYDIQCVDETVEELLFIFLFLVLADRGKNLIALDNHIKQKQKDRRENPPVYYVSTSVGGNPVTSKFTIPDGAILHYAFDKNIREGEIGTIYVKDSNRKALDDSIYLYREYGGNTKLVKSGTLESLCKSYRIKIKEADNSRSKERSEVYNKALSLLRSKLPNKIKSKGEFYDPKNSKHRDWCDPFVDNMVNDACLFYANLWDIDKEARNPDHDDLNYETIWKPLDQCMKDVQKELPSGYEIERDGDWDDIPILLIAKGKKAAKNI